MLVAQAGIISKRSHVYLKRGKNIINIQKKQQGTQARIL